MGSIVLEIGEGMDKVRMGRDDKEAFGRVVAEEEKGRDVKGM